MSEVKASPVLADWRLQPIVDAHSGHMVGCELLTRFQNAAMAERYFQHASPARVMQIFQLQQQWVQEQDVSGYRYFCNLTVSVLSRASFSLSQESMGAATVIELQDPEAMVQLSESGLTQLTRNLTELRRQSVSLWLDDITPSLLPMLQPMMRFFDGIKIDKSAFWRLAAQPSLLKSFVERCHQYSPLVLIEGVESLALCQLARQAGADYLQGYLWPEISSGYADDRQELI